MQINKAEMEIRSVLTWILLFQICIKILMKLASLIFKVFFHRFEQVLSPNILNEQTIILKENIVTLEMG